MTIDELIAKLQEAKAYALAELRDAGITDVQDVEVRFNTAHYDTLTVAGIYFNQHTKVLNIDIE